MKITQSYFNLILKNYYLVEKQPKIAVAVSGGPDSMALLYMLNVWIKKNKGNFGCKIQVTFFISDVFVSC